ncbi:MAG: hypothetical protein PQJ48_14830 [Sphaerochaetaceae bacterium]|nr:hypothetical protein [uncultured Sphaerochaeta sp.]MDC7231579.1 hypothetical protein [Sphaerochaetaceae bacterium]
MKALMFRGSTLLPFPAFSPGKTLIAPVSPGMRHSLLANTFDLQLKRGFHRALSRPLSTKEVLSVDPLPATRLSHRLVL